MRNTLVADTSVVFAALDRRDPDHRVCASLLASGVAVTIPAPVIVEIDWLGRARRESRAADELLASVADGSVSVVNLDLTDYARIQELLSKYADLPLEFVDASVITVAERMNEDTIATLDRRHFAVVRPSHVESFTLIP